MSLTVPSQDQLPGSMQVIPVIMHGSPILSESALTPIAGNTATMAPSLPAQGGASDEPTGFAGLNVPVPTASVGGSNSTPIPANETPMWIGFIAVLGVMAFFYFRKDNPFDKLKRL